MSSVASKILRKAAWLARKLVSTRFIAVMSLTIEITHALAVDFDHRGRDEMGFVGAAVLAPLRDFHVLDAPGLPNVLEKPLHLLVVRPHSERDDAVANHVGAGVPGDLVLVVNRDKASVGETVDRDIVRRRFEHLAQHRLAGLQPNMVAFPRGRGFRAQVYFAPEQAIVSASAAS